MKKYLVISILCLLTFISCKTWVLTKAESNNTQIAGSEACLDSTLTKMVKPYKNQLDSSMNEVIGVSAMEMGTGSPEGLLGNFISDLSLEIGNRYYNVIFKDTADFCLLNNGGFRTFLPKGNITRGKIFEIMPFENELVVVTLAQKEMIEMLTYIGVKTVPNGNRKQGVPVSSELKVVLFEGNVTQALFDNEPLSGKNYKVITTDYLANGGDNMSFLLEPVNYQKLGIKLRDAILMKVSEENEKGNKVSAKLDKRIKYDN